LEPINSPETSVRNYLCTLPYIPEEVLISSTSRRKLEITQHTVSYRFPEKFVETTTTSSSAASSSPEPTTPRLIKEDELEDEGRESPPEISSSTSDCSAGHSGGRSSKKSPPTSPPPPKNPLLQERFSCEELRHAVCHLETKDLWDKFNELGTEMIITKSGRSVLQSHFAVLRI